MAGAFFTQQISAPGLSRTMTQEELIRKAVDEFIAEYIDTVPHLEALLILWNSRPREWRACEIAKALYISEDTARALLQDLSRCGLVSQVSVPTETYRCQLLSDEKDALLRSVDAIYRREVVRISNMIHAKAPSSIREFARAFRFVKEKEGDKDKS